MYINKLPSCEILWPEEIKNMRIEVLILVVTTLTFVLNAKPQDTLVSGFFGLDNALPGLLAGRPGILIDGMPVNFRFPLDSSSLSVTDFEVVDSLGNIHIPMNAVLSPANENGENRTVLLLGEFGTAVTNPPVEVRVVGDLFTIDTTSKSVPDKLEESNGNLKLTGIPSNRLPSWLHNILGSALSSPKKADTRVSCSTCSGFVCE